jgi:hypothetical protein
LLSPTTETVKAQVELSVATVDPGDMLTDRITGEAA